MNGSPSYRRYHRWVREKRGTPNKCEKCGTTTAKHYEWASMTKKYDDIYDYIRLCVPCHRKQDGNLIKIGGLLIKHKRICPMCKKLFQPKSSYQIWCGSYLRK